MGLLDRLAHHEAPLACSSPSANTKSAFKFFVSNSKFYSMSKKPEEACSRFTQVTESVNRMEYAQLSTLTLLIDVLNSFVMLILYAQLSPLKDQIPLLNQISVRGLLLNADPSAIWVPVCLSVSSLAKVAIIVLMFERVEQPRPTRFQALFALVAVHDVQLFVIDLVMLICSIGSGIYRYIGLALLNLAACCAIKLYSELYFSNYAFTCGNPYKKLPNVACFAVKNTMFATVVYLGSTRNEVYPLLTAIVCLIGTLSNCWHYAETNLIDTPFIINKTASFCIVQVGLNSACVITAALAYIGGIFSTNSLVSFLLLSALIPIVLIRCRVNYNRNLLLLEPDKIEDHRENSIRLQGFYSLICSASESSSRLLVSFCHLHEKSCVNVDCSCKCKGELWDFRQNTRVVGASTAAKNSNGKIYVRHLLLSQCDENSKRFASQPQTHLLRLSALTMLGIFTAAYKQASVIEATFGKELSISDKGMLHFLRTDNESAVKKRLLSLSMKDVSPARLQQSQDKNDQLLQVVRSIAEARAQIWAYLNNAYLDMDELFKMQLHQQKLREQLNSIYQQCLKLNNSSPRLWQTMQVYGRFIVQDGTLLVRIDREIVRDKHTVSNSMMRSYIESQPGLSLLNNPNTCMVRVNHNATSVGNILWHCKNLRQVYRIPDTTTVIGTNVSTLLPQPFRQHHDGYIKRWWECPKNGRMNRFCDTYLQTYDDYCYRVAVYLKIYPQEEDFQLFGLMHKFEDKQYLLLSNEMKMLSKAKFIQQALFQETPFRQMDLSLLSLDLLELQIELEDCFPDKLTRTLQVAINRSEKYSALAKSFEDQKQQLHGLKLTGDMLKQALRALKQRFNSEIEAQSTYRQYHISGEAQILPVPTESGHEYCLVISTNRSDQGLVNTGKFAISRQMAAISKDTGELNEDSVVQQDLDDSESDIRCSVDPSEPTMEQICLNIHKHYQNRQLRVLLWLLIGLFLMSLSVAVGRVVVMEKLASSHQGVLQKDNSEIFEAAKLSFSQVSLLKYYNQQGVTALQSASFQQLNYLVNYAIDLARQAQLITSGTIIRISVSSASNMQQMDGSIFLESFLSRCKEVSERLVGDQKADIPEQFEYLPANVDSLVRMEEINANQLVAAAKQVLWSFQLSNMLLLGLAVLATGSILIVTRWYRHAKRNQLYALFDVFVSLDTKSTQALQKYYLHCKDNLMGLGGSNLTYTNFREGTSNRRRVAKPRTYNSHKAFTLLFFLLEVLLPVVVFIKTIGYSRMGTTLDTAFGQTLHASRQLTSADIYFMQLNFQNRDTRDKLMNCTNSTVPPVTVLMGTLNSFYSSQLPDRAPIITRLLTSDLCGLLGPVLQPFQTAKCLGFTGMLVQKGLTAANSFYHRMLLDYQLSNATANASAIVANPGFPILRTTAFLQFKALQLIRQELLAVSSLQTESLLSWNGIVLGFALFIKVIIASIGIAYCWQQYRHFHGVYQYLMLLPQQLMRDNCTLKSYLNRLNIHNRKL